MLAQGYALGLRVTPVPRFARYLTGPHPTRRRAGEALG